MQLFFKLYARRVLCFVFIYSYRLLSSYNEFSHTAKIASFQAGVLKTTEVMKISVLSKIFRGEH